MGGWMGGWTGGEAGLRIANRCTTDKQAPYTTLKMDEDNTYTNAKFHCFHIANLLAKLLTK